LRIDSNGSYWGALKSVFPAGTSQTCLQCEQVWNKKFKDEIIAFSKDKKYQNIDLTNNILHFVTKKIYLNDTYTLFNWEKKYNETKKLANLQNILSESEETKIIRNLKAIISPRITQDIFICGLCRFKENADIVGSANIAKRGINLIQKSIAT
jgi:hypothetical protein